ncbi:hypothetical protein I551_9128 [Mycobacterium ulcerans str. Harvey]|uniref:Uncharacterized protein n=1 Tax=Mycobacterium ulcerans str. Harvey TaxID=1299332 RepID=A0ABN0R8T3_MYCUL|nr:hypothetical protein MMSP_4036 [Mycobacterium sp. 012931]EUA93583.1 hypothetical protein I551_9128 [Mycobacterium ulcerans str. Harvey]
MLSSSDDYRCDLNSGSKPPFANFIEFMGGSAPASLQTPPPRPA